jgi:hypothetical protein
MSRRAIRSYFEALDLLAELIGLHPRRTQDQDFMQMLRRAGWRPFLVERYGR